MSAARTVGRREAPLTRTPCFKSWASRAICSRLGRTRRVRQEKRRVFFCFKAKASLRRRWPRFCLRHVAACSWFCVLLKRNVLHFSSAPISSNWTSDGEDEVVKAPPLAVLYTFWPLNMSHAGRENVLGDVTTCWERPDRRGCKWPQQMSSDGLQKKFPKD